MTPWKMHLLRGSRWDFMNVYLLAAALPAFTWHAISSDTRPLIRVVTRRLLQSATLFWRVHQKWRLTLKTAYLFPLFVCFLWMKKLYFLGLDANIWCHSCWPASTGCSIMIAPPSTAKTNKTLAKLFLYYNSLNKVTLLCKATSCTSSSSFWHFRLLSSASEKCQN